MSNYSITFTIPKKLNGRVTIDSDDARLVKKFWEEHKTPYARLILVQDVLCELICINEYKCLAEDYYNPAIVKRVVREWLRNNHKDCVQNDSKLCNFITDDIIYEVKHSLKNIEITYGGGAKKICPDCNRLSNSVRPITYRETSSNIADEWLSDLGFDEVSEDTLENDYDYYSDIHVNCWLCLQDIWDIQNDPSILAPASDIPDIQKLIASFL